MALLTLQDIEAARAVIQATVRRTPMKRSSTVSDLTGGDVHLKLENFQRTGSFKVRGALNKVHALTEEEKARGVVAASAGNHAQGVAYAATKAGVSSHIFMPEDAALAKVEATQAYGGEVHTVGRDYQEAYEEAVRFQQESGAVFVHAFDDPLIMAGQGTLGLEVVEDLPDVDVVLIPIGGGGLISGVATAIKAKRPEAKVIGVQAEGASTIAQSLQKGKVVAIREVQTMADGIACRRPGDQTFQVIQEHVDDVVTVSEAEIAAAILFLLERTKVVAEGAGAVALAAALNGHVPLAGKKAVVLVSGGNIDMTLLARIIQRGLVKEGRIAEIDTTIPDRPGQIAKLLRLLAKEKVNVLDVHHDRNRPGVPLYRTSVLVTVETRGPEHIDAVDQALRKAEYAFTIHSA